ncbi:MAG: (2Fe-2S)-binding protein [Gemmatimonadaceae bacterium]
MTIIVNGRPVTCASDLTVAAALVDAGVNAFRKSVTGEARGPVCGMGICYECRVTIDDVPHRRACLVTVEEGMRVSTGGLR